MELNNCRLGSDFQVSHHAEICQFDRFSLEINFKRARSCNYGTPRLVKLKWKYYNRDKVAPAIWNMNFKLRNTQIGFLSSGVLDTYMQSL